MDTAEAHHCINSTPDLPPISCMIRQGAKAEEIAELAIRCVNSHDDLLAERDAAKAERESAVRQFQSAERDAQRFMAQRDALLAALKELRDAAREVEDDAVMLDGDNAGCVSIAADLLSHLRHFINAAEAVIFKAEGR